MENKDETYTFDCFGGFVFVPVCLRCFCSGNRRRSLCGQPILFLRRLPSALSCRACPRGVQGTHFDGTRFSVFYLCVAEYGARNGVARVRMCTCRLARFRLFHERNGGYADRSERDAACFADGKYCAYGSVDSGRSFHGRRCMCKSRDRASCSRIAAVLSLSAGCVPCVGKRNCHVEANEICYGSVLYIRNKVRSACASDNPCGDERSRIHVAV